MQYETKYKWYKLDNAAKVFPDISSKRRTNMFRVSFNMTSEIDAEILQQAVDELKDRFPTFYVKLKKGLFWYYYEYNEYILKVKPENPYVCSLPNFAKNNNYMFNVFYYKKRISVEVFHALSDGSGVAEYTKALVFRYLQLIGHDMKCEGLVITKDSSFHSMEIEDSFIRNYDEVSSSTRQNIEKAYHLRGTKFAEPLGMGVICGRLKFEELQKLTKEKNVTVTEFLTALLFYSILKVDFKNSLASKVPIKIMIPVNMRKYYESKTLRNFSLYTYINHKPDGKVYTFDELLEITKTQLAEGLKRDNMQKTLNANVKIEKSVGLKLVPLFIKKFAIKIGYNKLGNKLSTMSFSNLGEIKIPSDMQKFVESVDWTLSVEKGSTHNLTVCTVGGITSITMSRLIYETEFERIFYSTLSKMGIDITLESNLWEENA